jgi:hypothetical protein
MKFFANLRAFLVALWLGAAVFFSFAVAPSVFAVLDSREMAGSVVNLTLTEVNYSGFIIGLILLASSFIFRRNIGRLRFWLEQGLLLILTGACGFGQFVISAKLHDLRAQLGRPIDETAFDDPVRVAFNNLHGYSVIVLSIAMISAIIIFFLLAQRANKTENR